MEVIQGEGAAGFEIIELPDHSTVLGLNAALENTGDQVFSAQLAVQEGLFTNLNLVNTTSQTRSITLTAVNSDGSNWGDPVQMSLEADAQWSQDAGAVFVDFGQDFTGFLRVDFDGTRVVGGFVTIASDQPLAGQMLFGFSGAEGITSYSAVPPTVVK